MTRHKNLVITRAGDRSLHEGWLNGRRNWDMIVSCFGDHPEKWQRDDVIHIVYQGGKGDGLYDAFQQIPGLLDKYDYIMMADDDIAMKAEDISRTFDIMRAYNLQIGKPSFSYKSHALYFPQFHNPRFKIRFSNFVEINTVCLNVNVWRQILPLCQNNPMANFIDNFWARLTDNPARQAAFIDDVQITHTRPFGGELHQKREKYNWPIEGPVQYDVPDFKKDLGKWDLPKIVCHAGILADGSLIEGREAMLPHLISGWREAAKNVKRTQMRRNRSVRRCIKFSIKNQRTGISRLTKTRIIIQP